MKIEIVVPLSRPGFWKKPILLGSMATLLFCGEVVKAGNTWDGGGGDSNWGTDANWSPDGSPAPGSGNDLFFAGATRLTPFNNYTAFDDWRNITFNSGASSFNITGNDIDLFGKVENLSSNAQTFGLGSIALNSATLNEFNPVNGNLTITSTNVFTNGHQLNVFGNNGFTLTFSAGTNIQGAGLLTINQNSNVVFNSAHTYTGDTFVNAGKLQFNTGGSASSSVIRIGDTSGAASAQVNLIAAAGGQTLSNTFVSRSGSSGSRTIDSQNTSGTNTLSGAIALDASLILKQAAGGTLNLSGGSFDVKAQTLTVEASGSMNISEALSSSFTAGGSLVKSGAGTLILSNTANTYTGTLNTTLNANGTQISGGVLGIHGDGSLGIAPAGAYNNVQFTGNGTLQDTSGNISLHANRNISIANAVTATLDSNGNTFTINSVINGTGGNLAKSGAGSVVVTASNTYTGTTTVTAGTLEVATGGALASTGNVAVNTGGTLLLSGTNNNKINNSAATTLAGGALVLGGSASLDEQVGTLSLSATSTIDFGTLLGGHTLRFADSSGMTWAGAQTLNIWNWTAGADHLFFGTTSSGLTATQLGQVRFYSDGGSSFVGAGGIGSLGEVSPIPEPSTVLGALALLGLVVYRERRRFSRVVGTPAEAGSC